MQHFIYIHGFNSSPQSYKAIETRKWLAEHISDARFSCPALPPFANQAMAILKKEIEARLPEPVYLLGSSMGGFFATVLMEHYDLRGVLINPAVNPHRGLHQYLGENANYHTGKKWTFSQQHIDEYAQLNVGEPKRTDNYWVLLQTGDEVLDYRDAEQFYKKCKVTVEEGGDHSFLGYHRYPAEIYPFLTQPN